MPVLLCPNGKYRIGSGPCVFDTKEKAQRAYRAYLWKRHGTKASAREEIDVPAHIGLMEEEQDPPNGRGPLSTQAVLLSKENYPNREQAIKKVKGMDYKTGDIEETDKYWRFRQVDPGLFKRFINKEIAPGILLVLGERK